MSLYLFYLNLNSLIFINIKFIQTDMLRPKSNSVCFPSNKNSKKHCVQDLACFHCCKCWLTHKKQCQIRNKTYNNNLKILKTQNQLLKQSIEKLLKELLNLKKDKKDQQNIEHLKQRLKADLRKQLDQQTKMNAIIQNQKIENLSSSLLQQKKQNQKMDQTIKQLLIQIGEHSLRNKQLHIKVQQLQQEAKKAVQAQLIIKKLQAQIQSIQKRQNTFKQDIDRKNNLIDKMQIQLKESQKIISTKTSLQSQYEFQQKKLTCNLKEKQSLIQNLTRTAENQMKGLSLLQFQNGRLNSLMLELDNELLQKEVQSNCLKRNLYDAENLAWHKQTKLQMLKSDIQELKYRL